MLRSYRHISLPSDHGSWVLLLSPLIIGLAAGVSHPLGSWRPATLYLVVAALAGFLLRQPVVLLVKMFSGRRTREDLPAAVAMALSYAGLAGLALLGLVRAGFGMILYLALPGGLVFAWYLVQVSRREERRRIGLEVTAAGALALAAPAGLWVGVARPEPVGLLLWLLVWAQSAAAMVFVHCRLQARQEKMASRSLMGPDTLLAGVNLLLAGGLAAVGQVPAWIWLPFVLQPYEAWRGAHRSPVGQRPRAIGIRQLLVSSLFTLLFVLLWISSW